MQESYPFRSIFPESTDVSKLLGFLATPLHTLQELCQRTTASRSTITSRKRHNAVINVDSHVDVVLLWFAVHMVWVEGSIRPAFLRLSARKAFKDQTSAHRNHVGGAPSSVVLNVGDWKVWMLWKEIESREKRDNVAVVYTTAC